MISLDIDLDRPWFTQIEEQTIHKALEYTDGNQTKAANILGISPRLIRLKISKFPSLHKYKTRIKQRSLKNDYLIPMYFKNGLIIKEIANALHINTDKVRRILYKYYDNKEYSRILAKNKLEYRKRRRNMGQNVEEIINYNKQVMAQIAERVRQKQELTDKQIEYARFLFNNGFMEKDGTITKEGIDALYH